MKKYKVLDAFSGAGGLSYGFEKQGHFEVVLAIENDKWAQETYKANHNNTVVENDITTIDFNDLKRKYPDIDVVIGGPPCQGFSNANRHSTAINLNNLLVKKYVELVKTISPKVFLMENVKMIASDTKMFLLNKEEVENPIFEGKVKSYVFPLNFSKTFASQFISGNIVDFHVNGLDVLLRKCGSRKAKYSYIDLKKEFETLLIGYEHVDLLMEEIRNLDDLRKTLDSLSCFQRMSDNKFYVEIEDRQRDNQTKLKCFEIKVIDYIASSLSQHYDFDISKDNIYNTVKFGVPQERLRYVLLGVRKDSGLKRQNIEPLKTYEKESSYLTVLNAIGDLENYTPSYEITDPSSTIVLEKKTKRNFPWQDSQIITSHCMTKSEDLSIARFRALKQGDNFHNLSDELVATYANRERTQNTVYRRLRYDCPSPTVTNVRKSMWIHPTKDRAISIREAARLQSFPDSYIFKGPKDRQYQQIGNAVPPLFAKELAKVVYKTFTSGQIENN